MEKRATNVYTCICMYVRKLDGLKCIHTYECVYMCPWKSLRSQNTNCACVCDLRIKCVGGSVCAYTLLFFRCSFLYCDTTTTTPPQQFQQQQRVLAASLTLDFEAQHRKKKYIRTQSKITKACKLNLRKAKAKQSVMYKNSFPVCAIASQTNKINNNKKKCQPEQKVRATIYINTYKHTQVYICMLCTFLAAFIYSNRALPTNSCSCHPHPDFRLFLHFAITRHTNECAHLTLLTHTLPLGSSGSDRDGGRGREPAAR